MKRTISSIVGIILLAGVMLAGDYAFTIAIALIALIGMFEMFKALENLEIRPVKVLGYLWCLSIPCFMIAFIRNINVSTGWTLIGLFITICILFVYYIFRFNKVSTNDITGTVFSVFYIVFTFLCLGFLRLIPSGNILIWIAFIGAWATDSFAYLAGIAFGKKKILPDVSPKKSLEGSVGGILGCIIIMNIFGIIFKNHISFSPLVFTLLGLLCGIFSQIGDWAMSALKRKAGIKDFGKIMPGHGGILDRFDSILFIAPMILGILYVVM